ncbi:MAG: ABC transporter substrate-binding protein [Prevotella sp.]|nr:ABC transporter substrate-binding protein [Prevotella sp.]
MKVRYLIFLLSVCFEIVSCGPSYDEAKKLQQAEKVRLQKEENRALKVGVLPTLDCLPIYVAKEIELFDTAKADVRIKTYATNIDCDAALMNGKLEGVVTDIIRGQYMKTKGTEVEYVAATNAYWQLISNKKARIKEIKQLNDKMVAMTRFSATALLVDYAVDSVKMDAEKVFKIQINDMKLRLRMLNNNEMDAMLLTEPQATTARLGKNPVLMDSRDKNMMFGVVAFRSDAMKDKRRKKQIDEFVRGYNAACDSINKYGVNHYAELLHKYYDIDDNTISSLPKMKFAHAAAPRQEDIETADKWLKKQQ